MHAGFFHFTRVRFNKHIPPFTGEGFLTLSPSPGFICCVSNCKGNAGLSPPRLASNGSIPLRSTTIFFAWLFILRILHRYSRLSMQCLDMTLQRAAVNQLSRGLCCISLVWLEHPAHNRTYIGSNPLCSTKIAVNPFTSVRQLNVKTAMTFSERR